MVDDARVGRRLDSVTMFPQLRRHVRTTFLFRTMAPRDASHNAPRRYSAWSGRMENLKVEFATFKSGNIARG